MSGIILYWIVLFLWAAVVTYFVVFDLIPMMSGKHEEKKGHGHGHGGNHKPHKPAPEAGPGYSVYEGFKSFANKDGKLTPEDIVKGLSRDEKDR